MRLRDAIQELQMGQVQMKHQHPRQTRLGTVESSFTEAYEAHPQATVNKDNVVPARKAKLARLERMQTLLDTMKAEAKRDKKKADARAKAVKKLKKAMKKKAAKKKALRKLLKKK